MKEAKHKQAENVELKGRKMFLNMLEDEIAEKKIVNVNLNVEWKQTELKIVQPCVIVCNSCLDENWT